MSDTPLNLNSKPPIDAETDREILEWRRQLVEWYATERNAGHPSPNLAEFSLRPGFTEFCVRVAPYLMHNQHHVMNLIKQAASDE